MRPEGGWGWYDPGNWCWATVWFLVRKLSRMLATQCEHARHLHLAMNECETRWPRQGAHFWELVGDLFEASLSHGYRETARAHVEHSLFNCVLLCAPFPKCAGFQFGHIILLMHSYVHMQRTSLTPVRFGPGFMM